MGAPTDKQLKSKAITRGELNRHFLVYVLVIALLWVIWAIKGSGYMWPIWPTGGWGIGILVHYFKTKINTSRNEI